jgi:hypothetical protein
LDWTPGENKANIMVHSSLFIVHSKDEERQFEKTKPICGKVNRRNISIDNGLWRFGWLKPAKKNKANFDCLMQATTKSGNKQLIS